MICEVIMKNILLLPGVLIALIVATFHKSIATKDAIAISIVGSIVGWPLIIALVIWLARHLRLSWV